MRINQPLSHRNQIKIKLPNLINGLIKLYSAVVFLLFCTEIKLSSLVNRKRHFSDQNCYINESKLNIAIWLYAL